jgi:hypothetical protein
MGDPLVEEVTEETCKASQEAKHAIMEAMSLAM